MGNVCNGIWKARLALALAAALGLLAQSAVADRGGRGGGGGHHSGGGSHFNGGGGHHSGGGGHFSGGGHFHGGGRVVVGPAFYPRRFYYYVPGPYYYYPPAYYPPPVAYAPPVLPSMNSGYLYFCPASQAYYPQVLECTSGWVQVAQGGGPPPG